MNTFWGMVTHLAACWSGGGAAADMVQNPFHAFQGWHGRAMHLLPRDAAEIWGALDVLLQLARLYTCSRNPVF